MVPGRVTVCPAGAAGAGLDVASPPGGVTSRDELRTTCPGTGPMRRRRAASRARSRLAWAAAAFRRTAASRRGRSAGRARARSLAEPLIVQAASSALPNSAFRDGR